MARYTKKKFCARAARARAFVRYTAPTLSLLADAVECPADGPASCSFFSHMECGTPPRASREAEVQRRALQEASSSLEFYGVFVVWPDRPKIFFARALRAQKSSVLQILLEIVSDLEEDLEDRNNQIRVRHYRPFLASMQELHLVTETLGAVRGINE